MAGRIENLYVGGACDEAWRGEIEGEYLRSLHEERQRALGGIAAKPIVAPATCLREDTNYDYRRASAEERMRSLFPGDLITAYAGHPDVQFAILAEEAHVIATQ